MTDTIARVQLGERTSASTKTCSLCRADKPLSDFGMNKRKTALALRCRQCIRLSQNKYSAVSRTKGRPALDPGSLPGEKECSRCRIVKKLDAFPQAVYGLYGRRGQCKECHNGDRAKQRRERPELVRAKDHAYRQKNLEPMRKYQREWTNAKNRANPGLNATRQRAEYHADAAASRARQSAYRNANREQYNAQCRLAQQRRRARLQNLLCLPVSQQDLLAKVAYWGWRCYICRGPWEAIDHVKPVFRGGGNLLSNFRPACTSCNTSKNARWEGSSWAMALVDSRYATST